MGRRDRVRKCRTKDSKALIRRVWRFLAAYSRRLIISLWTVLKSREEASSPSLLADEDRSRPLSSSRWVPKSERVQTLKFVHATIEGLQQHFSVRKDSRGRSLRRAFQPGLPELAHPIGIDQFGVKALAFIQLAAGVAGRCDLAAQARVAQAREQEGASSRRRRRVVEDRKRIRQRQEGSSATITPPRLAFQPLFGEEVVHARKSCGPDRDRTQKKQPRGENCHRSKCAKLPRRSGE